MPVENAPDEGRNEEGARIGGGDRLGEREHERHVAVDSLALELVGGFHAFPGRGELDENAVVADPSLLVGGDEGLGLGDHRLGVEREIGVHFGRHPAGDDGGQFRAEVDRDPVGHLGERGLMLAPPLDGLIDQPRVVRHLRGLEDQRRVGGRVGRLESADRIHVAGVGDDRGHGAQLHRACWSWDEPP